MSHNKDKWQAPLPQQTITHRLDPNLLYRIDYFLMLFAKSLGAAAITEEDKARMTALTAEGKELADRVKAIDDAQT